MKPCTVPPTRATLNLTGRMAVVQAFALLLGILVSTTVVEAQQTSDPPDQDKQTIRMLLQRIDQLEARVGQLEAGRQAAPQAAPAQAAPPATTPPETETEAQAEQPLEPERMDLSKTLLRMRGFGDITLHGDNQKGDTTSFSLGQLNLFVTSDVSERFKFLSEIVFEAGPNNTVGVDVERLLLQYSPNDYFNLAVGRYHTAIGYYNTAYHHSTWFQTTTGRPFLFEFEDKGGPLPIHNVGVSASGLIPSGRLGLHYVAEVGNGRASRSAASEPVQNVVDENNHKAFNLAFFVRPESVRGLQAGFSVYRDVLTPINLPRIGETILAAHAVLVRPKFEWLNEALVIRHAPFGESHVFDTPAFYTQLSKQFGSYRPYFRYQYMNESAAEPVFPNIGLRHGPSVGLRYDASESVAVKLQYDYTRLRQQEAINGLALQVGFTF
ncbi:MAG TPA: hypothetical protein VEV41_11845 [Terriglobales bacterium]|nr:hypothetical protein [Terriglobales bacterium]